jgi:hypothetical protein
VGAPQVEDAASGGEGTVLTVGLRASGLTALLAPLLRRTERRLDFGPKIKFGASLRRVLDRPLWSRKCTQSGGGIPPSPLFAKSLESSC